MDAIWNFRQAYNEARKIKDAQDAFCSKVKRGLWNEVDESAFPQDLQWEALVDVLRGKVKVRDNPSKWRGFPNCEFIAFRTLLRGAA
jgi:hypothetical protein